jgi:hypothetical protein
LYRTGPLVATIAMVLALASCGGGRTGSGGTTGAGNATISGGDGQAKVAARKDGVGGCGAQKCPKAGAGKPAGDCRAQLGEFVRRMTDLRQALLAGLSYAEYVVRVRAIRDAYEAVPVKNLDRACLDGPAGDAEDAFNQYLRAANAWGECAATEGCAASDIEGKLQRRWRIASKSLDQVQASA